MNTKRLTLLAMFIAIYAVLSNLSIRMANFKFTLEAFPILVAAFLLGPLDGFIVGTVGAFIYQLLFSGYGLTPTTVLWIIPHALSGLLVGFYAKSKDFKLEFRQIAIASILSGFLVTALNLLALYADSKLYGYYSKTLLFGNLAMKIVISIILAIVYASIMPRLLVLLAGRLENKE